MWLTEAGAVGLGVELELQATTNALAVAAGLPANRYLSLNASPGVVLTGRLVGVLARCERPIVVEVTEHDDARGVDLGPALAELRAAGHRIALDDGDAGYAGLTRILELRPDVVKLDRAIVAGIDTDPVRQAMVTAAVAFVTGVGTRLVAEGVGRRARRRRCKPSGYGWPRATCSADRRPWRTCDRWRGTTEVGDQRLSDGAPTCHSRASSEDRTSVRREKVRAHRGGSSDAT